jgi:hypothetical protein
MDQNLKPPRSRGLMWWLIVDTVLSVLAVVPAGIAGMMTVMASDAGTSGMIMAFIWTGLTFPIAVALSPILAWTAFALRRERTALIVSLAPVLWLVAFAVIFAVGL